MKKSALSFSILFIFSGPLSAQWNVVGVGTTQDLYSVDFYSLNDTWIGSYNQIVKTTTGGSSWSIINPIKDNAAITILPANMYDLALTSPTNAIGTGFFLTGNVEYILSTTNAGVNWNYASTNNTVGLPRTINSVDVSSARAVAVGNNGRIARSINSGVSWTFVSSGTSGYIYDVKFASYDTVFAAGDNCILRSVNGGLTWTLNPIAGGFKTVSCDRSTIYIGTSTSNTMMKSIDYGISYSAITLPFSYQGILYAVNKDTVLAAGNDGIYVSRSGGQYWEKYALPSYQLVQMFDFYDLNKGFAVGNAGYVIKTDNLSLAPRIPLSVFSVSGSSSVCTGDSVSFINTSMPGCSYQWQLNGVNFSSAYTAGIVLDTAGLQTISLIVTNSYGSDTSSATVYVTGHNVINPFTYTVSNDTICNGAGVSFSLPMSQSGVAYQLRKGIINVGASQNGTGGTLTFLSGAITGTTGYNIKGTTTNSCYTDTLTVYKTIYSATAPSSALFSVSRDTVCYNDTASLIVPNSLIGYKYTWYNYTSGSSGGTFVNGNGSTIFIPLPALFSNQTFAPRVVSISRGCITNLNPGKLISVVNLLPNFTFAPNPIIAGDSISITNTSNAATAYNWNFSPLTLGAAFSGFSPPKIKTYTAGTDTVSLTMSRNVCTQTLKKLLYVYNSAPSVVLNSCVSNSFNVAGIMQDMHVDEFKNHYIVAGLASGTGNMIMKLDSLGQIIWQKSFGGSNVYDASVISDQYGQVYLAGTCTSTTLTIGSYSILGQNFIVKFKTNGDTEWVIYSPNAKFTDLGFMNNELIAAGGGIRNGATIVQPNGNSFVYTNPGSLTDGDGFIARINSSGTIQQLNQFGTYQVGAVVNNLPVVRSVAPVSLAEYNPKITINKSTQDIYIAGVAVVPGNAVVKMGGLTCVNTVSSTSLLNTAQAYVGIYNFNTGWKRLFNVIGGVPDIVRDIEVDKQGGVYVTGNITKSAFFNGGIYQDLEASVTPVIPYNYLVKFDTLGNYQWSRISKHNFFHDLAGDTSGVYFSSAAEKFIGLSTPSSPGYYTAGESDFLIGKIDAAGDLSWVSKKGGATGDFCENIQADDCGNIFTAEIHNEWGYRWPLPYYPGMGQLKLNQYNISNSCSGFCVSPATYAMLDLAIDSIKTSPDNGLTGTKNISISIKNTSYQPVSNFKVSYQVNADPIQTILYGAPLAPGQQLNNFNITSYNFTKNFNAVKIWMHEPNGSADNNPYNDTAFKELYLCNGPMSGNYIIGNLNDDFNSFHAAFNALMQCGINSDVTMDVRPGTYSEQFSVNKIPGANSSDTVLFRTLLSDSSSVVLKYHYMGLPSNILVTLTKTKYLSFNGITFMHDQNLPGLNQVVMLYDSVSYVNFKNCNFYGSQGSSTQHLFYSPNMTRNTAIKWIDNTFRYGHIGIDHEGLSTTYDLQTYIAGNRFLNQRTYALKLMETDKPVIINNYFSNDLGYTATLLYLYDCLNGFTITGNEIYKKRSPDDGAGIFAYNWTASTGTSLIANNFIHNHYNGYLNGAGDAHGIHFYNVSNGKILHNSIYGGIKITGSGSSIVKNNILISPVEYFFVGATIGQFVSNYNCFYADTSVYKIKFNMGSSFYKFNQWQGTMNKDTNSVFQMPSFVSYTDMHILSGSYLSGSNTFYSLVNTDIDGDIRNGAAPVIGADEIPLITHIDGNDEADGIFIFPNPYSGSTQISYVLNKRSAITIEAYNAIGQKVETIVSAVQLPGEYRYNFSANEKGFGAGVYFVKITLDGKITTRRIVELK